ncbi:DUF3703 domain-containing protein [Pseudoalteromonas luteoviolacea]|uniref:DUF3703 domain-containing protein n=1 Tax=Pseudoalteromonas luteoviolacea S4054 TaxID=1129367 RepID=A0A0F6AHM8_9GAMM|nr:DUF3703 domain-containing protein [Pseudoalteromonas luteoviolacea]AOT09518.1 hypothetical protein S4054249_17455 [Pseudoalteromonas luteoviolacea]AOT14430.1 hypothetical protein S40542_17425 [Pseudoalteromonas luteoviolacea]AOT19346.1 hypothetical protein S4054_17430 [Pseudoalteromonas luteoviolacea]KKE85735.1 hypothetical protein N479_24915 [Pseudoalteromonas luteoviolacea S4054]KZN65319.1 hypothetical protein N481_02690 [Pseudoalteromonas luteoviolacea S4047-1]
MNKALKLAYEREMLTAQTLYQQGDFITCFESLERAHILGQKSVCRHTKSHWWMLKVGLKLADKKEVLGQILRVFAAIIFSRIWVPKGNTGGANVSSIKSMPIPDELKVFFNE